MDLNVKERDEDEVFDELLNEFNVNDNSIITPALNKLIEKIASTGLTQFPWEKMKKLIAVKLEDVITDFNKRMPVTSNTLGGVNTDDVTFEDMKLRLTESINAFYGAPFTVQRLCELMANPTKNYKTTEKFMRAIEKNLLVVSTVDPCGNKIVSEPRRTQQDLEPNGIDSLNQSLIESSPFLAPTSPAAVDVRQVAAPRFAMVRAPSIFNSPSLRGIDASAAFSQSSLVPFLGESGSRKRRRGNCESVAEKSKDLPAVSTDADFPAATSDCCTVDEEPSDAPTPLLGQLLSGGEAEHICDMDDKEEKLVDAMLHSTLPLCDDDDDDDDQQHSISDSSNMDRDEHGELVAKSLDLESPAQEPPVPHDLEIASTDLLDVPLSVEDSNGAQNPEPIAEEPQSSSPNL